MAKDETATTWQPIETAPELRKVLVTWVNEFGHRRRTIAVFNPAGTTDMDDDCPADAVDDNGRNAQAAWFECREASEAIDWQLDEPLTHWMPLPDGPQD